MTDFEPNAPVGLAVSNSGNLYCLDADSISMCNILRITSSIMDVRSRGRSSEFRRDMTISYYVQMTWIGKI